jgi:hypothetical protein
MGIREILYLVFGLALVNGVASGIGVQSFLSRTKAIRSARDLASFKSMVRQQMLQAMLQMLLLLSGCVIGIYGIITSQIGLLLVILLNGLILISGLVLRGSEQKARALPVEDPTLRQEYERVSKSWTSKPFPDF